MDDKSPKGQSAMQNNGVADDRASAQPRAARHALAQAADAEAEARSGEDIWVEPGDDQNESGRANPEAGLVSPTRKGKEAADAGAGGGSGDSGGPGESDPFGGLPEAKRRRVGLISIVWIIPLLALLAGIGVFIDQLRKTGPLITLTIPNAEGIRPETTLIRVLNVDIGRIVDVRLDERSDGVVMRARLDAAAKPLLREDTKFLVVKPRIDTNGVTGLNTLVSGAYIEMFPGTQGDAQESYKVSDDPIMAHSLTGGLMLNLAGNVEKLLPAGSPVLYKSINIGTVIQSNFDAQSNKARYQIFIDKPNDSLIGSRVKFILAPALKLKVSAGGISVESLPPAALLTGAITVSDAYGGKGSPVVDGDTFTLYQSESDVPFVIQKNDVRLIAFFKEGATGLAPRSPVSYKGIRVGTVAEVPHFSGQDKTRLFDRPYVPVLLTLSPEFLAEGYNAKLNMIQADDEGAGGGEKFDVAGTTESILKGLDRGLVASISRESVLSPTKMVQLETPGKNDVVFKPMDQYDGERVIGTVTGGLDEAVDSVKSILNQLEEAPLSQTAQDADALIKSLGKAADAAGGLLSDPATKQLPSEARRVVSGVNEILGDMDGSLGTPSLGRDVSDVVSDVKRIMPHVETLSRSLADKPNSLLLGSKPQDPSPRAATGAGSSDADRNRALGESPRARGFDPAPKAPRPEKADAASD